MKSEQISFVVYYDPKRIFRNGPPMIVVYATKERTISIFAVLSTTESQIELYITREDH